MKKMGLLTVFVKPRRTDSTRHLIDKNQEDEVIPDWPERARSGYDTSTQNTLNHHQERRQQSEGRITCEEAARLLGVAPDALTSEAGPPQSVAGLVEVFLDWRFPEIPADVKQNLRGHLSDLQETVLAELVRLAPQLHSEGLFESCHRQTFKHLDDLLLIMSLPRELLFLISWVLHTYLSRDLLGHPDLQCTDPIKKVDLLLLTQWTSQAEEKLFQMVMTDISGWLEKILELEMTHDDLYLDTIQCIDAVLKNVSNISPRLSDKLQEGCMRELLEFLKKYAAAQKDLLRKKAKMDKPETKDFFKNLNNCKKLQQYIQEKDKEGHLVEIIEDMEAFTLKLLREIVADIAERRLKKYFKSQNKEFSLLLDDVRSLLSGLSDYEDVQMRVMDEAYKLLAHVYLKRLVGTRLSRLRRRWQPDVGRRVTDDAELLHRFLSDLVDGVAGWNAMLLKVEDLLRFKDLDATKMTAAEMQQECYPGSEDLELLPALLQWRGLSGSQIRDVQYAMRDLPGFQLRPTHASWFSCFTWWRSCCTPESTVIGEEDSSQI
ncbi:uncharacterized protein ACO6RY_07343 [Pungitius sinensis]